MFVGVDGKAAGFLALSDALRENVGETVSAICATGIRPVLLTGDHQAAATCIAAEAGITAFQAE